MDTPAWQSRLRLSGCLFLLAAVYTLLDCGKPLVIDDAAYHYYAVQMAQKPLDPYGFWVYWWDRPYVANEVLAPPVLPYWWSVGLRLFGERPWLWKVWLLPLALVLVAALYALLRRCARGLEWPLLCLVVLSPALLPSLNLMLDVPALALALAAIALFLHACDHTSFTLAALAGVTAGVGMELKYTVFLAPAVMLLYAVLFGRMRLWLAAAVLAAQVFVSWEFLIALLYGQSHFLGAVRDNSGTPLLTKLGLLLPLLGILGGIAPALFLLGLAALRAPRWVVWLVGGAIALVYVLVAFVGIQFTATLSLDALPFLSSPSEPVTFGLEYVLFILLGSPIIVVLLVVAVRLCLRRASPEEEKDVLPTTEEPATPRGLLKAILGDAWGQAIGRLLWGPFSPSEREQRLGWFLVLWFALEVTGYFALTPFSAVRRVLGIVVVGTFLAGHLAALTCRTPGRRRLLAAIVAFNLALGLGYAALDWWEGRSEQVLAETAAAKIQEEGGGEVWFVGHWGFQYYAERAGMHPIVTLWKAGILWYQPNEGAIPLPPPSQLHKGDWVVVPDWRLTQQNLVIDENSLEPAFSVVVNDPVRLQTVMCYYSGTTPLEHRVHGTRLEVQVYRVTADFEPVSRR